MTHRKLSSPRLVASLLLLVGCGSSSRADWAQSPNYAPPPASVAMAEPMATNTESFADYGVNPFVEASQDRLSTFAIDVDTASYAISRRKLGEGALPPKEAVRVEEFVNAFTYGYDAPANEPFAVDFAAAPSPYTEGHHLLRVGLVSKRVAGTKRPPAHLVFLVDTSGSMQSEDKLGLVQETLKMLTQNLQDGDTVALCTYAGDTREVLPPTGMKDRARIMEAIGELRAGGGTAMSSGMETAYALASKTLKKGEINRVIVLSDGDANIGNTSHEEMLRSISQYKEQGITLSTVGFGTGNYKDTMMEQLADKGDGNYSYIDSKEEARKVFGKQLDATLEVVARDTKLQVSFDPAVVKRYRLVGYENRDVADKDFRNDKVDGGEVGAGHAVTALYELELVKAAPVASLATVSVRFKPVTGDQAEELSFAMAPERLFASFDAAPRNYRFAVAVAGFADTLRESPHAGGLDKTLAIAKAASSESAEDVELIGLVEKAIALGGKRAPLVAAQ